MVAGKISILIVGAGSRGGVVKQKQPVHIKATLNSVNTMLHKALIQGHTANSDILD